MTANRPPQGGRKRVLLERESTGKRVMDQSRIRILCVVLFFMLCFGTVALRLVELGFKSHTENDAAIAIPAGGADENDADAEKAQIAALVRPRNLQRGNIVDRNGVLLATSLSTASLFANPKKMTNKEDAARKLAKVFPDVGYAGLQDRFKRNANFVWIKRNLTPREENAVNRLGIPGLYFQPEERRVYPHGRLLSHVLGYVGIDGKGLAGVEQYFDTRLRDKDENKDPVALSIDIKLQNILYEELSRGVAEFRALGGTGIIMDIASGEILAMANLPDFDPHRPTAAKDTDRFNRAALGVYEMGSTFKTFTMAMALDNGVVTMQDGYDASHPIRIANFTISDAHPEGRWLSVPEIYAYSSNIGTAKMAMDVGGARQQAFLKKLGMMQPVSIEIPEKGQPRWPADWKPINTMTIAYGHGMSVSPLHLIRGIAAIVGNGKLPNLTLVKDGNAKKLNGPMVVKEETVQEVRRLMRLVVEHGTGGKANVPGYRVGGKTGTAEKVQGHGYNAKAKLTLFVSTFPVDQPKYVLLTMLDEPQPTKETFGYATGGWTAAPITGRIIARMGPLYGIAPVYDVPADDAEKYWPNHDSSTEAKTPRTPFLQKFFGEDYIHAVAYSH